MVSFLVASLSFPLWLRLIHYINLLFIGLLIRSGIEILGAHPRLYWDAKMGAAMRSAINDSAKGGTYGRAELDLIRQSSHRGLELGAHVAQASDGHLEVFTLDSHGALWHTRQIAPNGHWNLWTLVASPPNNQVGADSKLETTVNVDDLLEVFTIDAQGGLWNIWQTSSKGDWAPWASLGKPFGTMHVPVVMFNVARNADGHLELFTFGNDGALWHSWQLDPGGEWSL